MLRRLLWVVAALVSAGVAAWSLAGRGQAADPAAGATSTSTAASTVPVGEGETAAASSTAVPASTEAPSTSVDDARRAAYCERASADGAELAELSAALDSAGVDADPELFELRWGRFLTLVSGYWDRAPTAAVQEAWRSIAAPYYAIEPVVREAGYDLGAVPVRDVEEFARAVGSPAFAAAKQAVGASWSTYCGLTLPFPAP